ncbi:MBL fold metallo-hydrolase [Streptomyces sp. NPDC088760]|uniref:MBL fold metallo-hydrolase n=1 Tax=Streptomyces sp. NPDC088760 TaxID=3365890 RepID=UPI00382A171D
MPLPTGLNPRPGALRSLRLGEHTVTVVPDGAVQLHPRRWLPDSTDRDWAGDQAGVLDEQGYIGTSVAGLLVEYDGRALLLDAGFGPHDIPAEQTIDTIGALHGGQLPEALAQTGRAPADIEAVAFTHLHDDHIGWAFRPGPDRSSPFAGAALLASAGEWDGWPVPPDAVTRARPVTPGEEIFPGVTAWATPGHTRGHLSYVISGGGQRLIAFGDVFHTSAQLARPDWRVSMDALPEQAVRTRHEMLAELTRPDTLAFANHFAQGQLGRVTPSGGAARWEPLLEDPA